MKDKPATRITRRNTRSASVLEASSQSQPWLPDKWDRDVDVVIVGYGGAGAVAAINAAELRGKVLILEKAPQPGGSTSVSSGGLRNTVDAAQTARFIENIGLGSVDEETARVFADTWVEMKPWLEKHGARFSQNMRRPLLTSGMGKPEYFEIIALESREGYNRGCGRDFFAFLQSIVTELGIEVLLDTPAKKLIQNPFSKEILGVVAENNGREVFVKARKAVIMTCGGFAGNREMMSTFVEEAPLKMYPTGTPYCTGDGIKMVIEVGADLWHMKSVEWATQSFKPEEMPAAFWLQSKAHSWTNVNKYGKRFRDESISFAHSKRHPDIFNYSEDIKGDADFPNSTWFFVFDEKVRRAGAVVLTERWTGAPRFITYNDSRGIYSWSNDNRAEIERGWIKKADDLGELATIIGVDSAELQRTIADYNQYCVQEVDAEYKRRPDTLLPLDTPPYYAMECVMGIINTQGGPRRNAKSQVVGALSGSPIPRLYAGGEFGSIWNMLYPGGCNLSECIVSGLISSRNAMAEAPWE